jgi:hypothetical protein
MFKKKNKKDKPKKTRWYKQIWEVYKLTSEYTPLIWLYMLSALIGFILLGIILGVFVLKGRGVFVITICVPLGLLAAMIILTRFAESATYKSIEGKPGAAYAGIANLKRGWRISKEPIAMNKKGPSFVFRAIGRPGVILIAEGSDSVVKNLLAKERMKANRIAPGVPITTIFAGSNANQTPIKQIAKKIKKLPKKLSAVETSGVINRIESFGNFQMGIPKGIDPMKFRPSKKQMR